MNSDRLDSSRRFNADRPYAVVLSLDGLVGLQTARVLSGRGVPILGIAADLNHFCCRTKVCEEILTARLDHIETIEVLESIGPQLSHKAVLYPCNDLSVLLIARNRERLTRWFHMALPDTEVIELLIDKGRFAAHLGAGKLKVPAAVTVRTRADALGVPKQLTFPCVMKPTVKTSDWWRRVDQKVLMV